MSDPFGDPLRGTFVAVLDEIIPPSPERGLPGAGEAGCLDAIETVVAGTPELAPVLVAGLEAADAEARERGASGLATLPREARRGVLDAIAADHPGLVPSLVFHTYAHYYTVPAVVEALGLEARPPHPKGYAMAPLDETLLAPVKQRDRMFREA